MGTTTYNTRNDLSEKIRTTVIALLNQQLADVIDLGLQVKFAHWNVKGPNFFSLHELFDKIAEELEDFIDDIAERAVELGGVALGTLQTISRNSRLAAYPTDISAGTDHARALAAALAAYGATVRLAIESATTCGDAGTADLLTGVSRGVDKQLWLVEAHLHADS
ncbi:MAG: DNA starvation/stationary phase protection protein Dps [Pseudomonadota bacterium]